MEHIQLIFNIVIFGGIMVITYGVMKVLDHLFGLTEEEIEAYEENLRQLEKIHGKKK
jgi:hypothetical protein